VIKNQVVFVFVILITNLPEILVEAIIFIHKGAEPNLMFVEKWIAQPIQFISAPIMLILVL
jgi:hypothetical protein